MAEKVGDEPSVRARPVESKPRGSFVAYGRFVLALLALTSIFVGQLPSRVYFPFEQAALPAPGAFRRLYNVSNPTPTVSKAPPAQLAVARARLRKARIEALADVLVTRYGKWHRANRHIPGVRKLIWVGSGNKYGFGDRFRGIIHAYLCAVLTGRVLVLKWDTPFALSTIFQPAAIDTFWDGAFDGVDFPVCNHGVAVKSGECLPLNKTTVYQRVLPYGGYPNCYCSLLKPDLLESDFPTVVLRSEMAPNIKRLFQAATMDMPKLPRFAKPLVGLAQTWKLNHSKVFGKTFGPNAVDDAALFAMIFKAIFRPSGDFLHMLARQGPEVRSFIPERLFQREPHGDGVGRRGHVSIHARLGIGLGEKTKYQRRFGKLEVAMMAACMAGHAAEEADRLDLPEPQRFYLATDTAAFVAPFKWWLRGRSKGAIVVEGVGAMDKVHSNTLETGNRRDRERFLLTAADLFFLAAGDALISLPSGFSNLAAWFSGRHHTILSHELCVKERWHERPREFAGG